MKRPAEESAEDSVDGAGRAGASNSVPNEYVRMNRAGLIVDESWGAASLLGSSQRSLAGIPLHELAEIQCLVSGQRQTSIPQRLIDGAAADDPQLELRLPDGAVLKVIRVGLHRLSGRLDGITVWFVSAQSGRVEFADDVHLLDMAARMSKVGGWELVKASQRVRWTAQTFRLHELEVGDAPSLADALDISQEPTSIIERYGKGDPKNYGDGAPRNLEHFLMARRLVQAGCRVVTLNFGRWDFHSNNFKGMKDTHLPQFDQGLSALIEDLHNQGMADDVAVVAWGEFGRTPRINNNSGRDHWPRVGGGLLACGGFRTGHVIGATDRLGGEIAERPLHFSEVIATLYRHLGINPDEVKLNDLTGRPQYLLENTEPIAELT